MRTLSISTFLLLVSALGLFGQTKPVRAALQPIPSSATAPVVTAGPNLATTSIVVDILIISNTGSTDRTVTITDCQSTPGLLFNGSTIAANTTWLLPLYGTQFLGCFKWSASSTEVQGSLTGRSST